MHELSITQRILNIAIEKAGEARAEKVNRINLVVGELSGVIDDRMQFYIDFMRKDTLAGEAKLNFRRIPLRAKCRPCGCKFSPSQGPWNCPECGNWDAQITGGREFYVESLEVE